MSESRSRLDGIRTRRTLWLPPSHVTKRGVLPVTTPARTLIDTCGDVPLAVLTSAANDALRRGIMRTSDLARTFEQTPRSGRRASTPAKLLVARFVPGYDPGQSDAEVDIVDVLVGAGYPPPEQQIWVRGKGWSYRIDVGYRDIRHGFEFQSEQEHLNREAFHSDPLRTVRLQAAGWTIWPVTSRHAKAEILLAAATAFGQSTTEYVTD